MPRPRGYTDADLAVAAKQAFWDRGYEGTAIDDLQNATGLSRSSLYLAFGTKRAAFDAALAEYITSFIDPLLRPVEAPQAGLREIAAFFRWLADYFRRPEAERGCLFINSIAELAGRDPSFSPDAAYFINRLRAAFSNALRNAAAVGAMDAKQVSRRTAMLTVSTLGVWLAVRSDPAEAAATCRAIAREISSWSSVQVA
jgi:TetR/AcrR family transcriptional regulator, transcriptional repressor for nem operon